jgi:predicted O-methyltransferase YrrM
MLSGHFPSVALSMLSKLIRPLNILEIEPTLDIQRCVLCEGMQENGQLHTIDIKEELVDFQRKHFDKSWCKIVQHLGGG